MPFSLEILYRIPSQPIPYFDSIDGPLLMESSIFEVGRDFKNYTASTTFVLHRDLQGSGSSSPLDGEISRISSFINGV